MIYRPLGKTGCQSSVIGLGTWALGGPNTIQGVPIGWKPVSEQQAGATIRRARELGITFFDTSDFYGRGRSEQLLGKFLPASDTEALIATKVGLLAQMSETNPEQIARSFSPGHITSAVDRSLRRLRRDCIDLYQLHGPDPVTLRSDETWAAMDDLQRAGKIRFIGVSLSSKRFTMDDLTHVLRNPLIASIQIKYNLVHSRFEEALRQVDTDGRAILARAPYEHGLLLGKYRDIDELSLDDHRRNRMDPGWSSRLRSFRTRLASELSLASVSPQELALTWLLSDEDVTLVLCGATEPSQIEESAAIANEKPLDCGLRDKISAIARETLVEPTLAA